MNPKAPANISEISILDALRDKRWNDEELAYADYHHQRFGHLVNLLAQEFAARGTSAATPVSFMDIGPHMITGLVDRFFGQTVRIDTMGWENPRVYDPTHIHRHVQFDLNDAYDQARWPEPTEHDVVLMAEVLEHLYTAPEQVLACVRTFVRPGGTLIIGTPNAIALAHRLHLLAGRNPYERIRLDRTNPGHFREYTAAELVEFATATGFRVTRFSYHDFKPSNWWLMRSVTAARPSWRRMITMVVQRTDEGK